MIYWYVKGYGRIGRNTEIGRVVFVDERVPADLIQQAIASALAAGSVEVIAVEVGHATKKKDRLNAEYCAGIESEAALPGARGGDVRGEDDSRLAEGGERVPGLGSADTWVPDREDRIQENANDQATT
jgi:hypothetical protein